MKLIFLEIHGVLMLPICEGVARLLQKSVMAYKPAVDALNMITDATSAQIVVTSAWRNSGKDVMVEKFKAWGVKGKVHDITPIGQGKEKEISRYLIWAPIPKSYVVIDPADIGNTGYAALSEFAIKTDTEKGLTEEMAQKSIAILNKLG